jgi:hypothetical protein
LLSDRGGVHAKLADGEVTLGLSVEKSYTGDAPEPLVSVRLTAHQLETLIENLQCFLLQIWRQTEAKAKDQDGNTSSGL